MLRQIVKAMDLLTTSHNCMETAQKGISYLIKLQNMCLQVIKIPLCSPMTNMTTAVAVILRLFWNVPFWTRVAGMEEVNTRTLAMRKMMELCIW
jgi:hypothetical protein